jgi:hypothetical protein
MKDSASCGRGERAFQKPMRSLKQPIEIHERKIADDESKLNPDQGRIRHWKAEIPGFKEGLEKTKKRFRRSS